MKLITSAKVNLGLRILGRRPDGFHELETTFQTIDWGDELRFAPSADLSLQVAGSPLPTDDSNLVLRAARLLREATGSASGAAITLRKEVPIGGGLGGGSADAAATLLGLNRFWALDLTWDRLHPVAAELGSDVPFFLYGGTAAGRGRGEVLTALEDRPSEEILLVRPDGHLGAGEVYAEHARISPLTTTGAPSNISAPEPGPSDDSPLPDPEPSINDLEGAVYRLRPDLEEIARSLWELGASEVRVSGSGVCLFARFPGKRIPDSLDRSVVAAETRICRFVDRETYWRRLGLDRP